MWTQNKVIKAWNYASEVHKLQKMPGSDVPYMNHLGLVTMEAMGAVNQTKPAHPDLLVLCAILHDTIEDTQTTFEDIEKLFDLSIAHGVAALSKNKDLPSKQEQMQDSIKRIKAQPKEIWMVKLCDRVTNLQPPPAHWTKEKTKKYRKEAEYILQELGEANQYLANRLAEKIDAYEQYC